MSSDSSASAANATNSNNQDRPSWSYFNYGTPSAFTARNIYPPTIPVALIDPELLGAAGAHEDDAENDEVSSDYCSFCLQAYTESGEQKVQLEHCKHTFGKNCVAEYYQPNRAVNRCPICNDEIFEAPDLPEPYEWTLSEVVIRHCYRTFRAQLNRKIFIDIDAEGLSEYVDNALHPSTDWTEFWEYVQEHVEEQLFRHQNTTMTLYEILRLVFKSVEYVMDDHQNQSVDRKVYWASILPNLHTLVSRPHLLAQHLEDPDMKWLVKTAIAYTYAVEHTSRLATEQDEIDIREVEEPEQLGSQQANISPDEYWMVAEEFVRALDAAAARGEPFSSDAIVAAGDTSGAARALRAFNDASSRREGYRRAMEELEMAFERGEAPPPADILLSVGVWAGGEMDVDMLLGENVDEDEEYNEDDMDLYAENL